MGAILDRGEGARRQHLLVLLLLVATVSAVVATARRPPILDLPLLFQQAVAFDAAIAGERPELTIDWTAPNKLGYVPILIARGLAGTVWAPRIAVALVAAIWLSSIAAIAYLARRPAATTLLLAPLLFGSAFYAGFFNFLTGTAALLFWAHELDDRRRERPGPQLALSTAVGAALFYQAHVALLAVGGFAVASTVLLHRFRPRELAARALGLLPVAAALLAWSTVGTGWQGEVRIGVAPIDRVTSLGMASSLAIGGVLHPIEQVVLIGILGWIVLGAVRSIRERGAGLHPFLLAAGVCFLLMAVLAPNEVDKMVHVAWRWGGLALATLVLALPPPALDRRILFAAAATVVTVHLLVTAGAWRRWAEVELDGFEEAIAAVPEGAALFAVDFERSAPMLATYPSKHLYAWAAVERKASIRSTFTDTGHGLVRWTDPADRDPLAEFLLWQPAHVRPTDLAAYSHVLVHGPPAAALGWASGTGVLRLAHGRGKWGLFERR